MYGAFRRLELFVLFWRPFSGLVGLAVFRRLFTVLLFFGLSFGGSVQQGLRHSGCRLVGLRLAFLSCGLSRRVGCRLICSGGIVCIFSPGRCFVVHEIPSAFLDKKSGL